MSARVILRCLILLICLPCAVAFADYLRVSRSATIKAEPDRDAVILERVSRGDYLELLDDGEQQNGYYHVERLTPGQPGWIYRTLARRYRGEIPTEVPEGEALDPLADPTGQLTAAQRRFATQHLRIGKPQAVYERVREGYVVAQDARLKIPLWVQYELTRDNLLGDVERSDDYRPDASIPLVARADLADYSGSGFDRGHMAPAADMRRSAQVMSESFLLSNMAPQVGIGFNRHIWSYLEAAVRGWVEQRGPLTIIVGPVFEVSNNQVSYGVIGGNNVAVPTHFYKIVVDPDAPGGVETLAFLMPNQSLSGRDYDEFLTSIDLIETATGLDFLSALPGEVQERVESRTAANVW